MKEIANEKVEMNTLVSCTKMLDELGFKTQFKAVVKGIKSLTTERTFTPSEVKIVNFYRFEGDSNPDDNSILYAIKTVNGEKGTLTDGYGPTSDAQVTTFLKEVEVIEKKVDKDKSL